MSTLCCWNFLGFVNDADRSFESFAVKYLWWFLSVIESTFEKHTRVRCCLIDCFCTSRGSENNLEFREKELRQRNKKEKLKRNCKKMCQNNNWGLSEENLERLRESFWIFLVMIYKNYQIPFYINGPSSTRCIVYIRNCVFCIQCSSTSPMHERTILNLK